MNGMGEKMRVRDLIRLHSFQFYFWLISLTVVMNVLANKWLMYEANKRINSIYTYNYSLGEAGLIFLIPAFALTVLIIKGWNKLIYSEAGRKMGLRKLFEEDGLAIRGVYAGTKGLLYVLKRILKVAWLTVKYTLFGFIVLLLFLTKSGGSSTRSSGSSGGTSYGNSGSGMNSEHVKRKAKESAEWGAKEAEKAAIYAIKQAEKQGAYNSNTHHFDSSVNRANAKIREANKARKYADRL